MTIEEMLNGCADIIVQAAAEVVSNVFNSTPGPFRPVALAALRLSVESAVATMDAADQKMYTDTLENLTCTTRKIPKGGSEG